VKMAESGVSLAELNGEESAGTSQSGRFSPTAPRIRFFDPIFSPDEWDSLVKQHPESQIFHSAAWARILSLAYRHSPYYLAAFGDSGIESIFPAMEIASRITGRRGVSLPFSDACPPLHFTDPAPGTALDGLLKIGYERDWRFLRVSMPATGADSSSTSASCYCHWLDLSRPQGDLLARCTGSVRRAIRKAQDGGVAIKPETSSEALRSFYNLHCQTRRRHGIPPQPWKFFDSIYRELILPGKGFIFTAQKDFRTIAAAVFLLWQDKVFYKFAASDLASQHMRPNNLIIWEAIRFFAARGIQKLHFGRTDLTDLGLRRFKLGWGSKEETLQYRKFDFHSRRWSVIKPWASGTHNEIFHRMPLFMNRLAGAVIYPHLD